MKLFRHPQRIKSMDEHTIIQNVLSGESDDYAWLVERYHVGLIIYCENILHDRHTAEDIAQEAFIAAYQKLANFDSRQAKFSTWLYRIALYKCFDNIKKNKRMIATEDIAFLEAHLEHDTPDYSDASRSHEVRSAVDTLEPPTHKQAIEAYYWQGKTYQTIAKEMNIPLNTVRTYLRRGKETLRRRLS